MTSKRDSHQRAIVWALCCLLTLLICPVHSHAYTVVIDPGHGGEDHGAVGSIKISKKSKKIVLEKDVALELSNKLKNRILSARPDIKVVMTRESDTFVSLQKRGEIARRAQADLFISIHCNSHKKSGFHGFETYVLNNATDEAERQIQKFENTVMGKETHLDAMLTDLIVSSNIHESAKFANKLQTNISKKLKKGRVKARNRGIKQALFAVLLHSRTPGVLVEVGFLSNPKEAKRLIQNSYQSLMVDALVSTISGSVPSTARSESLHISSR